MPCIWTRGGGAQTCSTSAPCQAYPLRSAHRSILTTYTHQRGESIAARAQGSYQTGLTRSQAGRNKRRAQRASSASIKADQAWDPTDPAADRVQWISTARKQTTEDLLNALLLPAGVMRQRAAALLSLVEGRADLERVVLLSRLPALLAAVEQSDLLRRLMPGGKLQEAVMHLLALHAAELPSSTLLTAARVLSSWHPPLDSDHVAPAAVAVAAALAERLQSAAAPEDPAAHLEPAAVGSGLGLGAAPGNAATACGFQLQALGALMQLQPWLSWLQPTGEDASAAMAAVREAVRGRIGATGSGVAEAGDAAAERALALLQAATAFGVRVTAAEVQGTMALLEGTTTAASAGSASAALAAQVVLALVLPSLPCSQQAGADANADPNAGTAAAEAVHRLVSSQLSADGAADRRDVAFLHALTAGLQQHEHDAAGGSQGSAAAPAHSNALFGALLESLAASADTLNADHLAPCLACAAAAVRLQHHLGAPPDVAAVEVMFAAARAVAGSTERSPSPDHLCEVVAGAVQLSTACAAAAPELDSVPPSSDLLGLVTADTVAQAGAPALCALLVATAPGPWSPDSAAEEDSSRGAAAPSGLLSGSVLAAVVKRLGELGMEKKGASAVAAAGWSYEQAMAALMAVATVAEAQIKSAEGDAAATPSEACQEGPGAVSREALSAASRVACRALERHVPSLGVPTAVELLRQVARCSAAGVWLPPGLLPAVQERLRAHAPRLTPPAVLEVLRACSAMGWRPAVLLREMLTPVVRDLEAAAGAEAEGAGSGRGGGGGWTGARVKDVLMVLAGLGYVGGLAAPLAKLGLALLLKQHVAAMAAAGGQARGAAAAAAQQTDAQGRLVLGATDMTSLLWVCVAMQYRGAAVLRLLLHLLLQTPSSQVPVRAASQAVWAAARLGVVGERLVRWALSACQGPGKLAAAPPQSVANLCWGLSKLGVRPPPPFVSGVLAHVMAQAPAYKPEELSTTLFLLALWGARVGGNGAAAAATGPGEGAGAGAPDASSSSSSSGSGTGSGNGSLAGTPGSSGAQGGAGAVLAGADTLVRHITATCTQYDGPSLCVTAWALHQLTGASPSSSSSSQPSPSTPTSPTEPNSNPSPSALTPTALAAFESHLLSLFSSAPAPTMPFPDHHLFRFLSTCASASYTPSALLPVYTVRALATLQQAKPCPRGTPAALRRSKILWAVARTMSLFDLRNPKLIAALEGAAISCSGLLQPPHLMGILSSLAELGHYPRAWMSKGLLKAVGYALRSASFTHVSLLLQALAAWGGELLAVAESAPEVQKREREEAERKKAQQAHGETQGPGEEEQGQGQEQGQSEQQEGKEGKHGQREEKQEWQLHPLHVAQLKHVVLERLAALLEVESDPQRLTPWQQQLLQQSRLPVQGPPPAAAPEPSNTATGEPPQAAASSQAGAAAELTALSLPLNDVMRALVSLARLRWRHLGVEAVLLRGAARVAAERRHSVADVCSVMWCLAVLRHDAPDLMDDLQAALMGLPQPRPLGEEMALLESGRAGTTASSAGPEAAASAPGASAAATGPVHQQRQPQPPAASEGTSTPEAAMVDGEPQQPQLQRLAAEAATDARPAASPVAEAALRAPASQASATPPPRPTALTTAPSGSLLSRPQLPPTPSPTASADGVPIDSDTSPATAPPPAPAATPFDPAAATAAAAAAARERYERQQATHGSPLPSEPWTASDVFKALWSCAKMNRHPGPHILAAAERSWRLHTIQREDNAPVPADGTAGATPQLQKPPLHALTGLLWALATFRQHNGSFADLLATQLADRLAADPDALSTPSMPHLQRQLPQVHPVRSMQLASCLLAAQADRSDCPLAHALGPEGRARCIAAWRSGTAARAAQPPNRYQADMLAVLRKMGFAAAANVATPDGCTLVDVAVALPPPPAAAAAVQPGQPPAAPPAPRLLALELVGRHNSAVNSPRITGEAVLKYRLLQARGYVVVPVLCSEWDRIGHRDVWGKMVYLQAKIDRRAAPLYGTAAAAAGPAAAAAGVQAQRASSQQQQQLLPTPPAQ